MSFPDVRPRRLRRTEALRRLVRETALTTDGLVLPLFVRPGERVRRPIASMPGHCQLSVDELVKECREAAGLGIPAVLLFGIPSAKDPVGSDAYNDAGIMQEAVRAVKDALPDLLVVTDVCLCEYTDHGHCGIVREGSIDNDETLEALAKMSIAHARAGADFVAPSGMMDGMVSAIRRGLDDAALSDVGIMSYAVKYASSFYGPFREAADSKPAFGDRRSYQMDPGNVREALAEAQLDIDEGADIIMVKPALPYLDVVHRVR